VASDARGLAAHHRLLVRELTWVAETPGARCIIEMPPGSAKTTYATILFPTWFMARGDQRVIVAAHTGELAEQFSAAQHKVIRAHSDVLGYDLATEAVGHWQATNGSRVWTTGVGGNVTGQRGDLAVIDDPVKSAAVADSPVEREKAWKWFDRDLRTRIKPSGRIVLVMTRWHEDDLAGRLLEREPKAWRLLCLPALAEQDDPLGRAPGEPLWADDDYGFGAQLLAERERRASGGEARAWYALYQQKPYPESGAFFEPDRIAVVDTVPSGADVRAWDLAATAQGGDATVGLKLRRTMAGDVPKFCVLDVKRLRGSPEQVEAAILRTARDDGGGVPVRLPQDPGQAGKMQVQYLTARLVGFRVKSDWPTGSKETRAAPVASQVNAGNVTMLRGAWNSAFAAELRAFPAGREDDQVDALSDAFGELATPPRRTQWTRINFLGR
jgi:predicted phage terminase large subunit-like protein